MPAVSSHHSTLAPSGSPLSVMAPSLPHPPHLGLVGILGAEHRGPAAVVLREKAIIRNHALLAHGVGSCKEQPPADVYPTSHHFYSTYEHGLTS